ncbi:Cysteine desulfurase [Paenibacillus vortex V453]|uniref:Cysteine desulfurase n=1 Tax=Paenibacillus vortex V453 TaxID=715225 RepID=A0A2R9SXL4_9BACL|nr:MULTISPECIES: cysteine desulfurase family protein [Paenibacillus]EFU42073.1 Cysteine desulfurase [Paenibacillus vortex V453]MDH6672911.1 cysteine desulfurase [Paenibacillus sp. LBL]
MIYWDHAATTPPFDEVVDTMSEVMKKHYANPSALHRSGEAAAKLLRRAREVCAASLDVLPSELVFTSGATEGNNMAIKGSAMQYSSRGRHIITTGTEHPSVYECCKQLESLGWEVTYLPVDAAGVVDLDVLKEAVRKDTVLVSIMHVNNESGAIQPLADIGRIVKEVNSRTLFHVDGVQGFGKLPVGISEWQADLYSLSAHKFNGPRGMGVLYVKQGVQLFPLISGGSQENGLRAGTENVAGAVAMSKAMRLSQERQPELYARMMELRELLFQGIRKIPGLVLNSNELDAPHIIHFSYPGLRPEVMVHALEEMGMLISTKSACSSKLSEPSRVLLAMGKSMEVASSGIRISLGKEHQLGDAARFVEVLANACSKLRPIIEREGNRR